MISKELLKEVMPTYDYMYIDEFNIYELAHRCKEWAAYRHECFINIFQKTSYNKYTAKLDGKVFQSDTEPEAIFKACQWILDNKEAK